MGNSITSAHYSSFRVKGFRDALAEEGLNCATIEIPSLLKTSGFDAMWQMQTWLRTLSRPLGVFTVLDTYGSLLLQTAKNLGYRVPEDIAILSVGNDEFWCDLEDIPLSSVRLPSYQVGYEAARLLDDLITGRETGTPIRHPRGVTYEVMPRKSTDIIFVNDQAVARATLFIREHATRSIYVEDVVRASGISRVALQNRFKNAIGRSMLEEIRRVRIEHAKKLLRTTDTKLDGIAEQCSFSSSQRFCMTFRKHTGQSPGQYRRSVRKSSG